jgi:PTH1 family peptidyl-tRNA hydrolase
MKLIVGLGNPGLQYARTRHNIGFLLIDALVEGYEGQRRYKNEFRAETQKIKIAGEQVLVCKPQTFMNLSGEAVQPLMNFYDIKLEDILVAHDEIDQPFGQIKFQFKRGHGGHNGIRNIHQLLGTDDYTRLRMGVGRPPVFVDDEGKKTRGTMQVVDWVLQNFSNEEQNRLGDFFEICADGIEVWIKEGRDKASTLFNGRGIAQT